MADAGRDENLPRAEASGIDRVGGTKRFRMTPQIVEKNLNHPGQGRPKIGLLRMIVDRLNRVGISEREGNLNLSRAVRNHISGEPLAKPRNFGEKTAVIGIDLERLYPNAVNKVSRVRPGNYFAQRFLGSFENCQLHAVTRTEGDNSFIASLRCRCFGHHFHTSCRKIRDSLAAAEPHLYVPVVWFSARRASLASVDFGSRLIAFSNSVRARAESSSF